MKKAISIQILEDFYTGKLFNPENIKRVLEAYKPKYECHYRNSLGTTRAIINLETNEIYVETPIDIERNFDTIKDAINYAKTYGRIDARNK